jgi:hypothetical protein
MPRSSSAQLRWRMAIIVAAGLKVTRRPQRAETGRQAWAAVGHNRPSEPFRI